MKKLTAYALTCSILFQPFQAVAEGLPNDPAPVENPDTSNSSEVEVKNGWAVENGLTYYYIENEKVKGWNEIDSNWYYFDEESGARLTGWIEVADKWFFLDLETGVRQSGWIFTDEEWYYLNPETGEKQYGLLEIDGAMFYLDLDNGARVTGWLQLEGKWYYFDPETGISQDSWVKSDGNWYYLDSETGEKKTGWINYENKYYYLNQDGIMQTGWIRDGDKWYFLSLSGAMQTGWILDGGKWYHLAKNGMMETGWVSDNGKWYYLKANGAMHTGWVSSNGEWYYLGKDGVMQTGWVLSGNKWYYLDRDGSMKKGWHLENGKWFYLYQNGSMATGWYEVNSKWYYSSHLGVMLSNTVIEGYYLGYEGFWIPDIVSPRKTYTYDEMKSDIALMEKYYPDLVQTKIIGTSVEGRNIYAVKLGKGQSEIFLNGSHHAREHMTTNLLMEMMDQYIHSYVNGTNLSGYNVRDLLNKTSMWFVPMVNPDGVTLAQKGAYSSKTPSYLLLLNNNNPDFSSWKANNRGVDLNRQYPANWANIKNNTGKPSSQNFKGYSPLSEPEVVAVYNFTKAHNFKTAVAYHSAGEILYWNFKQSGANYTRDYNLALKYSALTGYSLVKPQTDPSGGGYTDWFIQDIKNPGFTPEISPATYGKPVPVSYFDRIWSQNKAAGLLLATEALTR